MTTTRTWSILGVLTIVIVSTIAILTAASMLGKHISGENAGIVNGRSDLTTSLTPDYEPYSVLVCKRDPYIDCRKRVTIYSSSQVSHMAPPLPVLYIGRIKDGREDAVTVDMTTFDAAQIGDIYDPDTGKLSHSHS